MCSPARPYVFPSSVTASVNPNFSNHKFFQKIFTINSAIYWEFQNRPNAPPPRLKTTKRRPLRTVAASNRQMIPSAWIRWDSLELSLQRLFAGRFAPRLVLGRLTKSAMPGLEPSDFGGSGCAARALRSNSFRPRRRFTARRLAGRLT